MWLLGLIGLYCLLFKSSILLVDLLTSCSNHYWEWRIEISTTIVEHFFSSVLSVFASYIVGLWLGANYIFTHCVPMNTDLPLLFYVVFFLSHIGKVKIYYPKYTILIFIFPYAEYQCCLFLHMNAKLLYSVLLFKPERLYLAFLILQVCHWTLFFVYLRMPWYFLYFWSILPDIIFSIGRLIFFQHLNMSSYCLLISLTSVEKSAAALIEDTLYELLLFCCLFLSLLKFDYDVLV